MRWLDAFVQDLRYGIRLLARNTGFATATILTVALGIGATSAVFTVVYGVVLRPLPYREPERLVSLAQRKSHRPPLQDSLSGSALGNDRRCRRPHSPRWVHDGSASAGVLELSAVSPGSDGAGCTH